MTVSVCVWQDEAWGVFAKLESKQKNQQENWIIMTRVSVRVRVRVRVRLNC